MSWEPEPTPKTPILFDFHGSRILKRFVHEIPGFGKMLFEAFKQHDTIETLLQNHEENAPTPYFVILSLLECKLGEVKGAKKLLQKIITNFSKTENKGVQKLLATLKA